jgi:hypothetical protein
VKKLLLQRRHAGGYDVVLGARARAGVGYAFEPSIVKFIVRSRPHYAIVSTIDYQRHSVCWRLGALEECSSDFAIEGAALDVSPHGAVLARLRMGIIYMTPDAPHFGLRAAFAAFRLRDRAALLLGFGLYRSTTPAMASSALGAFTG